MNLASLSCQVHARWVDINNVCVWDHVVVFTNSLGLFSLKGSIGRPEARAFPAVLCWQQWLVCREHVVIIPHATHTWSWRHMTGQVSMCPTCKIVKSENFRLHVTKLLIFIYKIRHRADNYWSLLSSWGMALINDWNVRLKWHLCCVAWKYQILTACEREVSVSECAKWLQV